MEPINRPTPTTNVIDFIIAQLILPLLSGRLRYENLCNAVNVMAPILCATFASLRVSAVSLSAISTAKAAQCKKFKQ
jgi:hypothetical protein